MKILNDKFHSCKIFNDLVHGILHENSISGFSICFEVDIYLLPYNKTTKFAIEAKLPLVFFARVHDVLEPLSGWFLRNTYNIKSLFSYGDPKADPVELKLKGKYAYATQSLSKGYVGFQDFRFVFGPTIQKVKFEFQGGKKVLNGHFHSCPMYGEVHTISFQAKNLPTKHCFEVMIYLLPYDDETRSAILDEEEEEEEVIEDDEESPEKSIDSLHSTEGTGSCRVYFHGEGSRKDFEGFFRKI